MVRGYQFALLNTEQRQTLNEHEHQDHIVLESDDEDLLDFGSLWWNIFCKLCDTPLAVVMEEVKHYAHWMREDGHG